MPRVAPFEALVYDAAVAGRLDLVTSRPYDVINAGLRGRYGDRSPFNVVRIDLPQPSEPGADPYAEAAATLERWIGDGVLRRSPPGWIAYELDYPRPGGGRASLRGMLVALALEPWGGAIVPHEEVMPGPIDDRLQLLRATRTHLSPIYGTVAGPVAPMTRLWDGLATAPPDAEVIDVEDVRHRTWWCPADADVIDALAGQDLLIADGHHRYTTALTYRDERHRADGPGPWDGVLAFVVDAGSQPVPILPYHRVQHRGPRLPDATTMPRDAALEALRDDPLAVVVVTGGDEGPSFAVRTLGGQGPAVAALHRVWLDRLADPTTIAFTHDADEAIEAVAGGAAAAYLLPPTDTASILRVVRAGHRLPRKSTFFWPKPRTGLAMMPLDPSAAPATGITGRAAPPAS